MQFNSPTKPGRFAWSFWQPDTIIIIMFLWSSSVFSCPLEVWGYFSVLLVGFFQDGDNFPPSRRLWQWTFILLSWGWLKWLVFSFSAFRILTLKGFYKRPNSECQRITKKENVPAFYAFVSSIQTILFLMEITSDSSTTSVEFICAFPVNWREMRQQVVWISTVDTYVNRRCGLDQQLCQQVVWISTENSYVNKRCGLAQ